MLLAGLIARFSLKRIIKGGKNYMCTPGASLKGVGTALGLVQDIGGNMLSAKAEAKNYKYKTQIAINNAKSANAEALRQKQLGIEEARKEKIEGIKQANLQTAKNAAGGMDITSTTSKQNYRDSIDTANNNALETKNQYNLKADSYFDNARSYLNEIDGYKTSYKNSMFNNSINSLNSVHSVADNWYEDKKQENKEKGGYKTTYVDF